MQSFNGTANKSNTVLLEHELSSPSWYEVRIFAKKISGTGFAVHTFVNGQECNSMTKPIFGPVVPVGSWSTFTQVGSTQWLLMNQGDKLSFSVDNVNGSWTVDISASRLSEDL